MDRMEQRVRDSLQARAADVEPSQDLWDEVGERIARRQRWRVSAWALAGVTAVVVGVLVVPGLVGGVITPPEIEGVTQPPEDGVTEDPAEVPVEEPVDIPTDEPGPTGVIEPVVMVDGNELVLLTREEAITLVELPEEGHSTFLSVAVRPGSTLDDLTVVTTTTAEGFEDIRWTRVVDGEVLVAHEAFEGPYAPAAADSDAAWVSPVVWSPDGGSVAWFDHTPEGTTLRTVGWDDGPGTGDPADDNAAFELTDDLPSGATLDDWHEVHDTRSQIRGSLPESVDGWFAIPIERQADGALALDPTPVVVWNVPDPELGPVGAVGGETDDGAPRWVVQLTDDGPLLTDLALGQRTELPDDLLPGEGIPELWLRSSGEGVIVGSRSTATAYLVVDGDVTPIDARVTDLARIR